MKNAAKLVLMLMVVGIALNGCKPKEDPTYQVSQLWGLWMEAKPNVEHYVRFTDEQSDEAAYLYGREWNEDEDVYEDDLFKLWKVDSTYVVDSLTMDSTLVLDSTLVHGNGWFKYKLEIKRALFSVSNHCFYLFSVKRYIICISLFVFLNFLIRPHASFVHTRTLGCTFVPGLFISNHP